jgi:predicted N-acyltransferase
MKLDLPSAEHRSHIRRFRGLDWLTDAEDVAVRGYVAFRDYLAVLSSKKARTTKRRRRRD